MMFKYLTLLFLVNSVLAQSACYGCHRIGSGNEYVSGIQKACYGKKYQCNILGYNCNTCWTNNPDSLEKWCRGNNFHDKDNNKDISYKVQIVGDFNCEI